jgi:hypothetical protein
MRRSRSCESQIVAIQKEAKAGLAIPEVVRRHGISKVAYFAWRTKYGGATVADLQRAPATCERWRGPTAYLRAEVSGRRIV